MSNAHAGISHPFGARHSGAGADIPLEDRLYGNWNPTVPGGHDVKNIEDLVSHHFSAGHEDLISYKEDLSAPRRYYRLGVRPLYSGEEKGVSLIYGMGETFNVHAEHMHFCGSDGSNFGMSKGSGSGEVFREPRDKLSRYEVMPYRLDAELIDKAKQQLDAEWENKVREYRLQEQRSGRRSSSSEPRRYNLFFNNCQDYCRAILRRARKLETKGRTLLF